MPFDIKEKRKDIETESIGFNPNTTRVRPAHIANGMFRTLQNEIYDTQPLFQFIFANKQDGSVPKGHEQSTIYNKLRVGNKIDPNEISEQKLSELRLILRKVLTADRTAYPERGMESYSAGFSHFISKDRIAQDGGEFLALWLQQEAPELAQAILEALENDTDSISMLAKPVLGEPIEIPKVNEKSPTLINALAPLIPSAKRLAQHLQIHPNKLTRLRFAVLFGSFALIRYLTNLEYTLYPQNQTRQPIILLDVVGRNDHPIRFASQRTYLLACQSLTRAYIGIFTDYLKHHHSGVSLAESVPDYGLPKSSSAANQKEQNEAEQRKSIWRRATEDSNNYSDPYEAYGQAIYDILALDANATPVKYFRSFGLHSGLLQPMNNTQPTKHFALHQDMLEVLVRGIITPGETLDLPSLLDRFWTDYGIIIGGQPLDEDLLFEVGITQADSKSLEQNREAFAEQLRELTFARLMADGIIEVTAS